MTAGYDRLRSNLAQLAQMAGQGSVPLRAGEVSSYDPSGYLVKVRLQPDDIETGWLPISTALVGQAWGAYFGPSPGDQALVAFLQGDINAGVCLGFIGSDDDPPPTVQSGEIHLRSKGDLAQVILKPDGSITSKGTWMHDGPFTATGEGTFNGGHTVSQHHHPQGVDSHGDTQPATGTPTG